MIQLHTCQVLNKACLKMFSLARSKSTMVNRHAHRRGGWFEEFEQTPFAGH